MENVSTCLLENLLFSFYCSVKNQLSSYHCLGVFPKPLLLTSLVFLLGRHRSVPTTGELCLVGGSNSVWSQVREVAVMSPGRQGESGCLEEEGKVKVEVEWGSLAVEYLGYMEGDV